MKRYYYGDLVSDFIKKNDNEIFGIITGNDQFSAEDLQKNTWKEEIRILKEQLLILSDAYLLFEYTIPRMGKRIDAVVLYKGIIFLLEFKVGEKTYPYFAIQQVTDYALDLSYFHEASHNKRIIPILICTKAPLQSLSFSVLEDKIMNPICCNSYNIGDYITRVSNEFSEISCDDYQTWINSKYKPTPTIIESAQALYRGHQVEEISRNDASAINLTSTTREIDKIIDYSKENKRKSICFITGVPGAGKTLAGLNIAIDRQNIDENEHAVFLSGNGPLVDVLQEALARDEVSRNGIKKTDAMRKAREFVQIIHHFRDEAISDDDEKALIEKVTIFDEAQRAWTESQLSKFMKNKKGILDFHQSEPEFLISVMDRHQDWSTIICLIGGGQEINTGEAGLLEWFNALRKRFSHWDVYISDKITEKEYTHNQNINEITFGLNCKIIHELHLAVSLRSFRSENVSDFVKSVLDVDLPKAQRLFEDIKGKYPIYITRDIGIAKKWVKEKSKGTQRYGMLASSGARRLREYGVWVQNKIDAPVWFLNDKEDIRSSYFLEETATEFDIQGLELDYTVLCWDANLRFKDGKFEYRNFKGTKWQNINKDIDILYLKNAYRVLMTRARQGFVIFIPKGNSDDSTRLPEFYDGIFSYFKEIGVEEIY